MQIIKKTTNFDFMGKRRGFLILSSILVVLSLAGSLLIGPRFGIDFVGGTEIQVAFKKPASSAEIRQTLQELGFSGSEVVTFGAHQSEFLIRLQAISPVTDQQKAAAKTALEKSLSGIEVSKFDLSPGGDKLTLRLSKELPIREVEDAVSKSGLDIDTAPAVIPNQAKQEGDVPDVEDVEEESDKNCENVTCTWPYQELHVYEVGLKGVSERVLEGFRSKPFGAGATKMRSEWVGPKVGEQLQVAGLSSIGYALVFIMLYIIVRFDFRFAPGAVAALIHDVIITMGIFTLVRFEVTLATIAALLTIIGYSLNDTIVIFDRIRENLDIIKEKKLSQVINVSINQTLARTLLTSFTTLLVVISILTIGWKTTIRDFAFALLIGVVVGTYSSVFVASPIVVWLDKKFAKKKA